jgi:phosphatidate cytidylyltransferase
VRVVSGIVLLALVLAAIWLRGPLLMVLIVAATALGAHEFYTMARRAGYRPLYPAGVALAIALALRGYADGGLLTGRPATPVPTGAGWTAEVIALVLVLVLGAAWAGIGLARGGASTGDGEAEGRLYLSWAGVGLTLAGAAYTGGLLGYAPLLAHMGSVEGRADTGAEGASWLLLVLLGTAACDTGAYFAGSAFGRRKLIPHVSPGKTWEGLAGGALGGVVAALVLSGLLGISAGQAVALGLLVCAAAVAGDLCESLLKRAAGVKDSGGLIPGHGGMLDRLDSVLFVLLAVYWFVQAKG